MESLDGWLICKNKLYKGSNVVVYELNNLWWILYNNKTIPELSFYKLGDVVKYVNENLKPE